MSHGRAQVGAQFKRDGSLATAVKFVEAYKTAPIDRVRLSEQGISADVLDQMAKDMSISKARLAVTLGVARSTVDSKALKRKVLSPDEGSRVLGMASLIGQVHTMICESGNPEGFNAAEWVARWIDRPLPALGGLRPAELMDTFHGQTLVSSMGARMQSGGYYGLNVLAVSAGANAPRLRWASDDPGCRQGSIYGQCLFDDQLHSLTRRQIAGDDAALNRSVAGSRHPAQNLQVRRWHRPEASCACQRHLPMTSSLLRKATF